MQVCSEAFLNAFGQFFLKISGNLTWQEDTPLVQATLLGSPLGGARQFVSGGIQNIGWNRLKEAGGIVLFGFSRGETAFHPALLKGVGHRLMNGSIGG